MEEATQADTPPTVEQMLQSLKADFALLSQQNEARQRRLLMENELMKHTLWEYIDHTEHKLSKQNGDLQRQLNHLQRDMRVLQRSNNALHTSPKTQFTRFKNLPLEIRERIWQLAVPSRLLRFKASPFQTVQAVSRALSVPTVAHVYRESRHVVLWRQHINAPSGRSTHLGSPSQLWRLGQDRPGTYRTGTYWTWFTTYKDILLLNPEFLAERHNEHNFPITRVAQHIVIEDCGMWKRLLKAKDDKAQILSLASFYIWVRHLMPSPGDPAPTGTSPYNLRTVDFAMTRVTKIDRYYPPDFVHRLFNGDHVKIIDLRDKQAVRGIEKLLVDELSQFMKPGNTDWPMDLKKSLKIFRAASATFFEDVRTSFLEELAKLYHRTLLMDRQKSRGTLPMEAEQDTESDMSAVWNTDSEQDMSPEQVMDPEQDVGSGSDTESEQDVEAELDREALDVWVKELTERLDIRLVHVFIRVDEMADDPW